MFDPPPSRRNLRLNQFYRNLAIWMLIALAMVFLFNTFNAKKVDFEDISFSAFTRNVDEGKVKEVTIKGQEITGKYADNAGREKKAFHRSEEQTSALQSLAYLSC